MFLFAKQQEVLGPCYHLSDMPVPANVKSLGEDLSGSRPVVPRAGAKQSGPRDFGHGLGLKHSLDSYHKMELHTMVLNEEGLTKRQCCTIMRIFY